MHAQIELTNGGVKWLTIYNSSNFDEIVNSISDAIGSAPVKDKNESDEMFASTTSSKATWTISGTNGRKSVFEYKKVTTFNVANGEHSIAYFTSTFTYPAYEKSIAQSKFDDLYRGLVKEIGNPQLTFSPANLEWETTKVKKKLQLKQENNEWKVVHSDRSKK